MVGCFSLSSSSYDTSPKRVELHLIVDIDEYGPPKVRQVVPPKQLPNPKPDNYRILMREQIGRWLIVSIQYPDCTNYEGKKILVYKDVKENDLKKQKLIDPHFSRSTDFYSPFARFEPTQAGWEAARLMVVAHIDKETLIG